MLVGEKIWQSNSVVVDLVTLKLLIFYGNHILRNAQIAPDRTGMSVPLYCYRCYRATYEPTM